MIDGAGIPLRAMILLGINCGFGNADCGRPAAGRRWTWTAAWIDFARPKTGTAAPLPALAGNRRRRCATALARRPDAEGPRTDAGLFFVTKYGGGRGAKDTPDGPVTKETASCSTSLGINGRRRWASTRSATPSAPWPTRRRTSPPPITSWAMKYRICPSVYRETISDERLKAVSDHVHAWLSGNLQ